MFPMGVRFKVTNDGNPFRAAIVSLRNRSGHSYLNKSVKMNKKSRVKSYVGLESTRELVETTEIVWGDVNKIHTR